MPTGSTAPEVPPRSRAVLAVAAALFVAEVAVSGRYGVFRDELYYVACGRHLAFGYVDHAPLVAWMARLSTALFADWVPGLRVLPALLGAATVFVGGEAARLFGGRGFAQTLAAVCIAAAPTFLGTFHFMSMNCVLPVAWTLAAFFAARAIVYGEERAWIAFGVACGVGLLAKHSTLFFGAALAAGLVVTPARRELLRRGPWTGLAIAAILFAPNVAWEIQHGWPTLEFMHNAQAKKMVQMGALTFVKAQAEDMLPLTLPVWVAGVAWLLFARRARPFMFLGVAFVALLGIVMLAHGKPYYVAPAFPLAFAAGAVALEAFLTSRLARAASLAALALGGAAVAPLALPVLSPDALVRYVAALGIEEIDDEKHDKGLLPQFFADHHGWEALAQKVATAYRALTPEEQRAAALFGGNYGEAGALDFFGPRLGLPPAVSPHNNYFLWGPPLDGRGEIMIAVADGATCEDWSRLYERVEKVGETDDPYAMPYERHVPICVLRGLKRPIAEAWPRWKNYI